MAIAALLVAVCYATALLYVAVVAEAMFGAHHFMELPIPTFSELKWPLAELTGWWVLLGLYLAVQRICLHGRAIATSVEA